MRLPSNQSAISGPGTSGNVTSEESKGDHGPDGGGGRGRGGNPRRRGGGRRFVDANNPGQLRYSYHNHSDDTDYDPNAGGPKDDGKDKGELFFPLHL